MKTYDFKTSLKCDGCVAKITPGMNAIIGVERWNVDITAPVKVLHVESERDIEWAVMALLKEKGYNIELLEKS